MLVTPAGTVQVPVALEPLTQSAAWAAIGSEPIAATSSV
jgi:hypothetical protein